MKDFKLTKIYVVEFFDKLNGKWSVLCHSFSRKVAIYQYNKAKNCFKDIKYRLYVTERIL